MSEITTRIRAALWWLVPLAAALAALAWETDFGRAIRRPPPAAEAVPARPVVTSLLPEYAIAGATAARADTVQRTLFNPTRRPAPVAVAEAAKPRMQRGQFALTGTMVVGGKSTAFLRETAGGKSRRVQQGEAINGMIVADVKPDRVRLALGDESEELVLRVATNPRPTTPPAAAAATAGGASGAPPVPVAGAAAPPVTAAGASGPSGSASAEGSLAERRRAARAAQAAIQAQTSTPDGNPIPSPAAPPAAPATSSAAPPPGSAPDPRWQDVYRQYQNRSPSPIAK